MVKRFKRKYYDRLSKTKCTVCGSEVLRDPYLNLLFCRGCGGGCCKEHYNKKNRMCIYCSKRFTPDDATVADLLRMDARKEIDKLNSVFKDKQNKYKNKPIITQSNIWKFCPVCGDKFSMQAIKIHIEKVHVKLLEEISIIHKKHPLVLACFMYYMNEKTLRQIYDMMFVPYPSLNKCQIGQATVTFRTLTKSSDGNYCQKRRFIGKQSLSFWKFICYCDFIQGDLITVATKMRNKYKGKVEKRR